MARDVRSGEASRKAGVEVRAMGEAALVNVQGLVDEHFTGFGTIAPTLKTMIIDVSLMTRMTSFGVRQWLKAIDALPKTLSDLYLIGCPTFFVDQLNMVLNFGGASKVLTVMAPYNCPSCGQESSEIIDVLADRATLAKGGVSEKECGRCGARLEFDETPESYFSFVTKYAASSIQPAAAQLLASVGLYMASETVGEKPPRIIKLVHGAVTYFRIIGTIGSMFRARPFLVGAEGEVVIDLVEVDRFDPSGRREWNRLIKNLVGQVSWVTLVDVPESFLANAGDTFTMAKSISCATVLAAYMCVECQHVSQKSLAIDALFQQPESVCSVCGGISRNTLRPDVLTPLQRANPVPPPASAKLIEMRQEVLSRAVTDANVASAGDAASASLRTDDTILGKYKIVRRLSAGGMAEVFLAKQVGIGGFEKPVALKRILRQLLESRHLAVDMFLNEAKIAGRLMHPNIVQVLDVGEVAGALYLAMEYVHGKDLRELLKKLRTTRSVMPLGDACFIISQIAQALHHAYWSTDLNGKQLSVVHRDVSPHNVIISYDGTVKLLDFGVAMSAVTEHSEALLAGKWAYMSPEHTTQGQIDHRSDLFSVGVMMYLLVTGTMPFGGSDPREIVKKIRNGVYKPIKQVAPDIPDAVADLVGRLLAPRPDDRPRTGQEVVTALNDFTRSYGLTSSAAQLSALLAQMFEGESSDTDVKELVRATATSVEMEPTRRVAVGSGSTPTPIPGNGSGASPDSPSQRVTPSSVSGGYALNQSVSLVRRSSPVPQLPQPPEPKTVPQPEPPFVSPNPPPPTISRTPFLIALALLAIGLGVGVYLVTRLLA